MSGATIFFLAIFFISLKIILIAMLGSSTKTAEEVLEKKLSDDDPHYVLGKDIISEIAIRGKTILNKFPRRGKFLLLRYHITDINEEDKINTMLSDSSLPRSVEVIQTDSSIFDYASKKGYIILTGDTPTLNYAKKHGHKISFLSIN